jgi:hypothetical protein
VVQSKVHCVYGSGLTGAVPCAGQRLLLLQLLKLPTCNACLLGLPACRFFIFIAYLFLLHQMGIALFRLMGALGRELNRTNMFGSFVLVLLILLSGFALKRPDIHPWWIWVYWASPITVSALSRRQARR